MKPPSPTHGIVCALWTPLTAGGRIDQSALDTHLDWLNTTGLDGYLVLGSTGRFVGLPVSERESLAERVLRRVEHLPVLINVSHLDQQRVARLGIHAREIGAAGVTVLPPWYYEQAQADLVEWFAAAGEAARLPLWLYNFPERTGNRIDLATVRELLERMPLAGFKNSGANHELIRDLAQLAKAHPFAVFAGADARIPESLELGAVGCIGGLANALPEPMVALYQACKTGEAGESNRSLRLLRDVSSRLHLVPFPLNVAAVMEARGLNPGVLPVNLSRVTQAHYQQLKSEVAGLMRDHELPIF